MVINNKKKATLLKRVFYLISVVMAIFMLVMFLTDENLKAILTGAAFMVWFFIFQLFDIQYIEFITNDQSIILRYFPAIKFGKKEYNSIEFAKNLLKDVQFEKSVLGLVTDIVLIVKTKRGIAEYPSVSLAAVKKMTSIKLRRSFILF